MSTFIMPKGLIFRTLIRVKALAYNSYSVDFNPNECSLREEVFATLAFTCIMLLFEI